MAGCYHDQQDFKSDLKIEIAREGDILQEGQDLDEIECYKNPGHQGFIPFKDLTLEHLPNEHRNIEVFDKIKKMGSVVVRLVVDKIKNGRWIREVGSGCLFKIDYENRYLIRTNNHVVKTDDDVKHCSVEFHYDDSRSDVLTSRGVKLVKTCPFRDVTLFTFHPIPDFLYQLDIVYYKVPTIVIMYKNNQIKTEIANPYTGSDMSQLKFFSRLNLNSSLINLMFISWPDRSISYITSSYFKFQPIPSNIQQLTSIEIHLDEDDGNSRVIPGDVVQFGDEFVVDISESISQDEVKKCRLVWNGETIGCGTRLYFQQVKASNVFRGIDLEHHMEVYSGNIWILKFHPIPTYLQYELLTKTTNHVCCIGHPHGGIKMVTFGRALSQSLERFDNQYRRITQTNPDCQCKEVDCIKYSCKTCPGSSGSPVYLLCEEIDLGSIIIHFMGERVEELLPNGELVENKNIAWCKFQEM